MKKLYRYSRDCGRMGDLEGLFVADDKRDIGPAIGRRIYFGEILGKHSEVIVDLRVEDLTVLSDDQIFIEQFERCRCWSGHNPLRYINCPKCGDPLPGPYTSCECGWRV